MKSYFIFMALILLAACGEPAATTATKKEQPATARGANDLSYCLKDSLTLDTHGNAFECQVGLINDKPRSYNLYIFKVQEGSLRLYNIDRKISIFVGRFPREKANFFIKADTVFAWVRQTMALDIYRIKNRSLLKLKTLQFPAKGRDKRFEFDVYPSDIPFNFDERSEAILQTIPRLFKDNDSALYFQTQNLGIFRLEKNTIALIQQLAPYPEAYRQTFIGGNSHFSYCLKTEDTISYMFQDAPVVYEYDRNTRKLHSFRVEGLPVNVTSKYDCSQSASFQYDKIFHIENDWYVKLLYDKKQDRYLVFRVEKIAHTRPDGMLAEWDDKPVDLFIIDRNKRVVRTYHLPDQHTYFLHQSFIYEGYLYLIRNVNNNQDRLIADKYEI